MQETSIIVEFLLSSILAGLVATAAMTSSMHLLTFFRFTNADMVRAIGSIFTRSMESALLVGGILHTIAGIGFAMIYIIVMNLFPPLGFLWTIGLGALLGLAHGFAMSFILVATVAEHHPIATYRQAGMGVAVAHIMGHVVFGIVVGTIVALLGFRIG